MGLPQIIIAIILGVVLISMNSSFLGDTFSEGSARATSGTLISQSGQINEAADTYRALNSGNEPADLDALTLNGEFLGSAPNTGIKGVTWTVSDLTGATTILTKIAITDDDGTGDGISESVCFKSMEAAGATRPVTAIPAGASESEIETMLTTDSLLYGCYNDGTDNVFYRR